LDIKLKNKNLRILSFVLALYLLALSFACLSGFKSSKQFLKVNPYFQSNEFIGNINNFLSIFVRYNIDNKDYLKKSDNEKINKDELDNLKANYDAILENKLSQIENNYSYEIQEAENNGNKDKLTRLSEERNKKLEETKKENTKTIDDIKKELVEKSDSNYNNLKKEFEARNDLRYYFKDTDTGDVYTNLKNIDNLQEYINNNALYTLNFPLKAAARNSIYDVNHSFLNLGLEGYIIIPNNGAHLSSYNYYNKGRIIAIIQLIIFMLSFIGSLYLLKYSRKNNIDEEHYIKVINNIYGKVSFDLKIFILALTLIIAFNSLTSVRLFYGNSMNFDIIPKLTINVIIIFYLYISLPEAIEVFKNKEVAAAQLKSGVIYNLKETFYKSLKNKTILFKCFTFTIFFIIFGVVIAFLSLSITNGHEPMTLLIIFIYLALFIIFLIKQIMSLDKIIQGTDEIVKGNLNYTIKESGKGNFSKLSHNINNMKSGISKAVENQMKSDRLKSELITNVSHDLKTPLTSIITYVDLLKREELTKEEMQDYISVLDRKTQRLKVLIEDLFEASKMASGAVELNIERIDIAQLLNQALAEFDEKIKASSLTFRVNIPHHKIFANLDGKKTWRVFENLIVNILKYSQPNTRVYIELIEDENNIIITMKNISAYEMDFQVEELFERFKRGDASRATEGSGLGLAISKSIVDLEGGKLDLEIDGDLFKVIVQFTK
jgi:signal transduction histidine kinase